MPTQAHKKGWGGVVWGGVVCEGLTSAHFPATESVTRRGGTLPPPACS